MAQLWNSWLKLFVFINTLSGVFSFKRIVNGIDANENEFKFVVSLQRNDSHFCGGTILDESHILTAAHCVCNVNWNICDLLEIKLTPLELNNPEALNIPVEEVICHDYDVLELIKDIAILKLSQKIPSTYYESVTLADQNFSTAIPLYGVLVGWGLRSTTGVISNTLQKVDVVVYNDALCAQSYYGIRNIEHQICSGWPQNGRGSCQGDSGGPLLVGGVQIGVISFGDDTDCAISDISRPKISARVSTYLEWINEVIGYAVPNDSTTAEETNSIIDQTTAIISDVVTSSTGITETSTFSSSTDFIYNETDVENQNYTTDVIRENSNKSSLLNVNEWVLICILIAYADHFMDPLVLLLDFI